MPRSYEVIHETEYRYEWPADSAWQLAHLRPRVTDLQSVSKHHLEIEPLPSEMDAGTDYFGNPVQRFAVPAAHDRLQVRSIAEVTVGPKPVPVVAKPWEKVVQAVVEGDVAAGMHAVRAGWSLSAGMYVLRVSSASASVSAKFVVTR